ncbi:rod shape-determining protein MreD [Tannerella forsythia]|uniref:Rod shape-determining protein MreD n=1 Tax=Tannerella forsythia TaxID=28112 RepID=A0A3P1YPQ9_TANFO|nr:rod shape-determining protein MreD [Tannerella forsythia]RRD58885.1 rod shape-determining protein MreD [Tannerella forsythia]RRD72547.1 rod shape-determining protein MreD [Tannerella forsythia]
MIKNLFRISVSFIVFVALQVLVLNHIHLFHLVTPFLYLYIILKIPLSLTRAQVLWVAFLTGLTIDIFSNTLGMHAAACTLIGLIRNPLLRAMLDRDIVEDASPSYTSIGAVSFMKYTFGTVLIHHLTLFLIESVSLFDPLYLSLRIVSSVVLTSFCIFIVETFNLGGRSGES